MSEYGTRFVFHARSSEVFPVFSITISRNSLGGQVTQPHVPVSYCWHRSVTDNVSHLSVLKLANVVTQNTSL